MCMLLVMSICKFVNADTVFILHKTSDDDTRSCFEAINLQVAYDDFFSIHTCMLLVYQNTHT